MKQAVDQEGECERLLRIPHQLRDSAPKLPAGTIRLAHETCAPRRHFHPPKIANPERLSRFGCDACALVGFE